MQTENELSTFLRNLANEIETGNMDPIKLQKVSDFHLQCRFQDQLETMDEEEFSKEDMIKFISLGWYVYHVLLKDNKTA